MILDAHYYIQTTPSVNNLPTQMVYPSHTYRACIQLLDLPPHSIHLFLGDRVYWNLAGYLSI